MNHYYLASISDPQYIERAMDRDRERNISFTIHWHKFDEPCLEDCTVFNNG